MHPNTYIIRDAFKARNLSLGFKHCFDIFAQKLPKLLASSFSFQFWHPHCLINTEESRALTVNKNEHGINKYYLPNILEKCRTFHITFLNPKVNICILTDCTRLSLAKMESRALYENGKNIKRLVVHQLSPFYTHFMDGSVRPRRLLWQLLANKVWWLCPRERLLRRRRATTTRRALKGKKLAVESWHCQSSTTSSSTIVFFRLWLEFIPTSIFTSEQVSKKYVASTRYAVFFSYANTISHLSSYCGLFFN